MADGVEHVGYADGGELGGQHWLPPTRGHERHGRQVVDFVRPHLIEQRHDGGLIEQIGLIELDLLANVIDAARKFSVLERRTMPQTR